MTVMVLLPEFMLVFTLIGLLLGEIAYRGESRRLLTTIAVVGQASALIQMFLVYPHGAKLLFHESFAIDGIAVFFKFIFILFGLLSTAMIGFSKEIYEDIRAEYLLFQVAAVLLLCITASSTNLLLMLTGIFAVNAVLYFMTAFPARDLVSTEAAMKFYLASVVSFVFFFIGIILIYQYAQSLSIFEIRDVLLKQPLTVVPGAVISGLFLFSLLSQIGAFPFHFWIVDALNGAPTPTEFFMITAIRGAGFVVLLRLLGEWMTIDARPFGNSWAEILKISAALSMIIGASSAILQTHAKRVIGYLVVAQTGFLLVGLTVMDSGSISGVLIGYLNDAVSLCGAYLSVCYCVDRCGGDELSRFGGIARRAVPEFVGLVVFLASFVGMPPFPGFISKWVIISALFREQSYLLGTVTAVTIILMGVALIRLVYSMIRTESEPREIVDNAKNARLMVMFVMAAPMLFLVFFVQSILTWSEQAIRFVLW